MAPKHRQLLETLRQAFPQPVSDPVHDGYFVFSILRALDQVDALKSQTPILGPALMPNFAAARESILADGGRALEAVIPELVQYLQGMFIWGHPRSQINVVPQPSIASIIGVLLPSTYNPNLCSDESGRRVSEAEVRVAAMMADLLGYDPQQAAGVFTFGGTGGLLYGVKVGLEKAVPGSSQRGLREDAVMLASTHSHYSCLTVAAWLGIGQDNVVSVPSHLDNSIQLPALEAAARTALEQGQKIAAFVATMGSTDAFGIDDLEGIVALRDRLVEEYRARLSTARPCRRRDRLGLVGVQRLRLSKQPAGLPRTNRAGPGCGATSHSPSGAGRFGRHRFSQDRLRAVYLVAGFVPRSRTIWNGLRRPRETMPYLYQSGEHHPGMYTLETSRSRHGTDGGPWPTCCCWARKAFARCWGMRWKWPKCCASTSKSHPNLTVLNGENVGPVTLFRAYPDGVDTFSIKERERSDPGFRPQLLAYNDYNRRIYERVHAEALAGRGVVISLTDCYRRTDYGEPIVALKSYVLSPFADESRMESIIRHVLAARDAIDAEPS